MSKKQPKKLKLFSVEEAFGSQKPKLVSVNVTDSGGKFLSRDGAQSSMAFGFKTRIPRNKYPLSALDAWKEYYKRQHDKISHAHKMIDIYKRNANIAELAIGDIIFKEGRT